MNTSNFWWEIIFATLLLLSGVRLVVQFKKLKTTVIVFLALSYLSISFYFFKEAFFPDLLIRYGHIDVMAGILGLCAFSLLSVYVLILVPKAQEKIRALFRFPLIGILLGTYIGVNYTWLTFLVVNCAIISFFLFKRQDYKKLFIGQIISCLFLAVSFFVREDVYFISSLAFLAYIISSFQVLSQGLVGMLFRNEDVA